MFCYRGSGTSLFFMLKKPVFCLRMDIDLFSARLKVLSEPFFQ